MSLPELAGIGRYAEESRVCASTGLSLRRSSGEVISRIAKESYGPLNPARRPIEGSRSEWSRFDVAGHRTVYGGSPEEASYAESLAAFRVSLGLRDASLGDLFDDESNESLLDAVEAEWCEKHHMSPGKLPAGWREERRLYKVSLPHTGWFVEVETAESIAAMGRALDSTLSALGLESLSVADLKGPKREVTTRVAEWVRGVVLDDGRLPLGIVYHSKHSTPWRCWAIWLRAVDDGKPLSSEPTSADEGIPIARPDQNPALAKVADLFELTVY